MAIDPQAQRAEGVNQLPPSATRGSVGKNSNGSAVGSDANLPTTNLDQERLGSPPGGHVNRGIEPNTNLMGMDGPCVIDTVTAGERPPMSEPFNTPDASARMSTDLAHADWDDSLKWGADSSIPNQRAIPMDQLSTYDMIGEEPQGEGAGEAMEGGE